MGLPGAAGEAPWGLFGLGLGVCRERREEDLQGGVIEAQTFCLGDQTGDSLGGAEVASGFRVSLGGSLRSGQSVDAKWTRAGRGVIHLESSCSIAVGMSPTDTRCLAWFASLPRGKERGEAFNFCSICWRKTEHRVHVGLKVRSHMAFGVINQIMSGDTERSCEGA